MLKKPPKNSIVTIGICPAWDMTYKVRAIKWGGHKKAACQTAAAAGKALNVSRALDWLKVGNVAAGLWGAADYTQMTDELSAKNRLIAPCFTVVPGHTRQNVTIVDTEDGRQMHIRAQCRLANKAAMKRLAADLKKMPGTAGVAVFSGSVPDTLLKEFLSLIELFGKKNVKVAVDTSGRALEKAVKTSRLYLIKPNLDEFRRLADRRVDNNLPSIVRTARTFCKNVPVVIVSRGEKGAIAVTENAAVECRAAMGRRRIVNTVGCGDYLLAGFLSRNGGDICNALATGVKAATAKARGLTERMSWKHAADEINVKVRVHTFEKV